MVILIRLPLLQAAHPDGSILRECASEDQESKEFWRTLLAVEEWKNHLQVSARQDPSTQHYHQGQGNAI